jgi:hypothetical protein
MSNRRRPSSMTVRRSRTLENCVRAPRVGRGPCPRRRALDPSCLPEASRSTRPATLTTRRFRGVEPERATRQPQARAAGEIGDRRRRPFVKIVEVEVDEPIVSEVAAEVRDEGPRMPTRLTSAAPRALRPVLPIEVPPRRGRTRTDRAASRGNCPTAAIAPDVERGDSLVDSGLFGFGTRYVERSPLSCRGPSSCCALS